MNRASSKQRLDGDGLVVNKPAHLAARPLKRMLVPSIMNNQKGEPAVETGTAARYYTGEGCQCIHCRKKGAKK